MPGVLDGLQVFDLARGLAGSLAGAYLSDQGAEVIKVEPPEGDPTRAWSASRVWNRGKKSAVIDLTSAQGKAQFEQLVSTADVLLESFRPGTMARLGLDYDTLHPLNPRLIYCSITGYGRTSAFRDRPAYDALSRLDWECTSSNRATAETLTAHTSTARCFLYVPLPSYGAMLLASAGISAPSTHAR